MTIYQEAISVDSPQLLVVHGLSRVLYRGTWALLVSPMQTVNAQRLACCERDACRVDRYIRLVSHRSRVYPARDVFDADLEGG